MCIIWETEKYFSFVGAGSMFPFHALHVHQYPIDINPPRPSAFFIALPFMSILQLVHYMLIQWLLHAWNMLYQKLHRLLTAAVIQKWDHNKLGCSNYRYGYILVCLGNNLLQYKINIMVRHKYLYYSCLQRCGLELEASLQSNFLGNIIIFPFFLFMWEYLLHCNLTE